MNRFGTGSSARRVAVMMLITATTLCLQTAAASAKPKPRPKPPKHGADLIITHLAVDAGTPPYVVVGTDGTFSDFSVEVTVKNAGDRTAGRSHLKLWINQAPLSAHHIAVGYAVVPHLAPKQPHTVTFDMSSLQFRHVSLTPIFAVAKANYNLVVPEIHYTNNTRYGREIPLIAREWKVTTWSTHSVSTILTPNGPLTADSTNDAMPGFVWKFSGFDRGNQIFTYLASGGVNQDTKLTSPPCSGAGDGTAMHNLWPGPNTEFAIDYSIEHYGATLSGKNEKPYSVPYTCKPSGSGTTSGDFVDLETYGPGPPPQSYRYGARTLQGSGKLSHATTTVNFSWRFDADVP